MNHSIETFTNVVQIEETQSVLTRFDDKFLMKKNPCLPVNCLLTYIFLPFRS